MIRTAELRLNCINDWSAKPSATKLRVFGLVAPRIDPSLYTLCANELRTDITLYNNDIIRLHAYHYQTGITVALIFLFEVVHQTGNIFTLFSKL